jgi:hypothetical protein
LLTYSEQFDSAAWTKQNGTVTANAVASPDGATTADKFTPDTTSAAHTPYRYISLSSGTLSVYAKAAGENYVALKAVSGTVTSSNTAVFDLVNGTVFNTPSGYSTSIESVGNGWYRCSMTPNVSITAFLIVTTNDGSTFYYSGDGTSGIYLWGAQLEAGAFPTSYIPTSGSTATRSADIASIPVSDFGYNQKSGSLLVEFETNNTSNVNVLRLGTKSSYDNGLDLGVSSGSLEGAVWFNNTKVASYNGASVSANTSYKMAATVKPNDVQFAADGSTSIVDTSAAINPAVTLLIGDKDQNALFGAVNIKSIQYYPRRLTNTQLQEVTS